MTQELRLAPPPVQSTEQTTCCIVGAGPAGTMLAFMLARQGIPVILLESHLDFDRDFRGDTLHPSILEVLDELGLAGRLLQLPHTKLSLIAPPGGGPQFDLHKLKTRFPFVTMMPQTRFLTFITNEARRFPTFRLVMGARVEALITDAGQVRGVRYRAPDGRH